MPTLLVALASFLAAAVNAVAGRGTFITFPALTGILGLAQSGVSRHLGLLKDAGLVQEEKNAGYTYYRLSPAVESDGLKAQWAALQEQFETAAPRSSNNYACRRQEPRFVPRGSENG